MKVFIYQRLTKNLSSREFISYILKKYYSFSDSQLDFKLNSFGKPYIDSNKNLYFNCSHSYDLIVCAVGNISIGIDVEKIASARKILIDKVFSISEKDYVNCLLNYIPNRFTIIWTRKEAYSKWLGTGMKIPIASIDCLNNKYIRTFQFKEYYISIHTKEKYSYLDTFEMVKTNDEIEGIRELYI